MKNSPVLFTAWPAERAEGGTIRPHVHSHHELVYYKSGKGISEIGGDNFKFSENTFALIESGKYHSERHLKSTDLICIGFCSDEKIESGLFSDKDGEILRITEEILREAETQPPYCRELLPIKLSELTVKQRRLRCDTGEAPPDFTYAINFLKEYCHEDIDFRVLAARMNLSYDCFRHRFKEITGLSPGKYLSDCRLNNAKRLLKESDLSCTEIALRCGFASSARFSMMFRRSLDLSPAEYRKIHKK